MKRSVKLIYSFSFIKETHGTTRNVENIHIDHTTIHLTLTLNNNFRLRVHDKLRDELAVLARYLILTTDTRNGYFTHHASFPSFTTQIHEHDPKDIHTHTHTQFGNSVESVF